ncbi:NUDIX domain-containing protein [Stenotrophomonas maltophilia]|uniref:NUDIX domain-containing protein n=1 Tax=Stenotrophomonas maltophilia TaxID=40324 RepID=UPI0013DCD0B1|nr:NUDIX domain-containing protein [Stenotrophomonas maltophilia]
MSELQIPRVGCGTVVHGAQGHILLIQRGRNPERGHWGSPGCKVDWYEARPLAAAKASIHALARF